MAKKDIIMGDMWKIYWMLNLPVKISMEISRKKNKPYINISITKYWKLNCKKNNKKKNSNINNNLPKIKLSKIQSRKSENSNSTITITTN
jgi:hypothetical protein